MDRIKFLKSLTENKIYIFMILNQWILKLSKEISIIKYSFCNKLFMIILLKIIIRILNKILKINSKKYHFINYFLIL